MKAFGEATSDSAPVYFWDVNEATPDSARPNRHPAGRTFHPSRPQANRRT